MTRRRFIADTSTPASAALTGDQALHLARVLRAQPGQVYDVVANGFLHRAEITSVSESEVLFTLHEELEADAALPLHLLIAIFKFDHFEWAIEKATELGIARITPILARRTEKHLAQAATKRVERWRRIAFEAAKQSRRTDIPEVADPSGLTAALAVTASIPHRILLSETEQSVTLTAALTSTRFDQPLPNSPRGADTPDRSAPEGEPKATRNAPVPQRSKPYSACSGDLFQPDPLTPTHAVAIGPEGGWTPEEMSLFEQHQWLAATLGPRILRAETAAIAAIAIASVHLA